MSDNIVSSSCSMHLCLILYWDDVFVATYDIIVLTSCIVPSCLILVLLHHALCHVLTSWVYRHDWEYCVCTVQCNFISDFLYLHREFFRYIWYYCIYTMHCSSCLILLYSRHLVVTTDISLLTSCNVVSGGCEVVGCDPWWPWCDSCDSDDSTDSDDVWTLAAAPT
jgi:hypothetical protein